jgi:hypothetical protein
MTCDNAIWAGRRALIWPIHYIASVPAITSIHGTIASSLDIYADRRVPGIPAYAADRTWVWYGCSGLSVITD